MKAYLGIDIGTYESKGALVDSDGVVLASASRPHKMLVPQAGWAEHRAGEDWWGDFAAISRELIARSGIAADEIRAVGCSGIGPCVLPVDETGTPLCNAILYGVDTRAAREIEDLNAAIGSVSNIGTMVFASGVAIGQPFVSKISEDQWREVIETEIIGLTRVVAATLPLFREQGGGNFVIVVSVANTAYPPGDALSARDDGSEVIDSWHTSRIAESLSRARSRGSNPSFVRSTRRSSSSSPPARS